VHNSVSVVRSQHLLRVGLVCLKFSKLGVGGGGGRAAGCCAAIAGLTPPVVGGFLPVCV
jgi:hypothetical protein